MAKYQIISSPPLEEEGYFVSMTDMMVGLLFIFILILMYFALQFHNRVEAIGSAEKTRKEIVNAIKEKLEEKGIKVEVDPENGILRLSDQSLHFNTGSPEVDPKDREVIPVLASALQQVLPCYANSKLSTAQNDCAPTPHYLEAVFIEGHTDNDAFKGGAYDNWELSTERAVNTYKQIIQAQPALNDIQNGEGQHLLSVSGYADKRPIQDNDSDAHKRGNRRIDLRFIMVTPKSTNIQPLMNEINGKLQ